MTSRPGTPPRGATIFCPACGYALDGLPAGRCPECGRRFDPARPSTVYADLGAAERRRLGASATAAGAIILLVTAAAGAVERRWVLDPVSFGLVVCGALLRRSGRRGGRAVEVLSVLQVAHGCAYLFVAAAMLLERVQPGPAWVPQPGGRAWVPAAYCAAGLVTGGWGGTNLRLLARWRRQARLEQEAAARS